LLNSSFIHLEDWAVWGGLHQPFQPQKKIREIGKNLVRPVWWTPSAHADRHRGSAIIRN
jgi:hypothetical protein